MAWAMSLAWGSRALALKQFIECRVVEIRLQHSFPDCIEYVTHREY